MLQMGNGGFSVWRDQEAARLGSMTPVGCDLGVHRYGPEMPRIQGGIRNQVLWGRLVSGLGYRTRPCDPGLLLIYGTCSVQAGISSSQ